MRLSLAIILITFPVFAYSQEGFSSIDSFNLSQVESHTLFTQLATEQNTAHLSNLTANSIIRNDTLLEIRDINQTTSDDTADILTEIQSIRQDVELTYDVSEEIRDNGTAVIDEIVTLNGEIVAQTQIQADTLAAAQEIQSLGGTRNTLLDAIKSAVQSIDSKENVANGLLEVIKDNTGMLSVQNQDVLQELGELGNDTSLQTPILEQIRDNTGETTTAVEDNTSELVNVNSLLEEIKSEEQTQTIQGEEIVLNGDEMLLTLGDIDTGLLDNGDTLTSIDTSIQQMKTDILVKLDELIIASSGGGAGSDPVGGWTAPDVGEELEWIETDWEENYNFVKSYESFTEYMENQMYDLFTRLDDSYFTGASPEATITIDLIPVSNTWEVPVSFGSISSTMTLEWPSEVTDMRDIISTIIPFLTYISVLTMVTTFANRL